MGRVNILTPHREEKMGKIGDLSEKMCVHACKWDMADMCNCDTNEAAEAQI